jgi:hypothetical protein
LSNEKRKKNSKKITLGSSYIVASGLVLTRVLQSPLLLLSMLIPVAEKCPVCASPLEMETDTGAQSCINGHAFSESEIGQLTQPVMGRPPVQELDAQQFREQFAAEDRRQHPRGEVEEIATAAHNAVRNTEVRGDELQKFAPELSSAVPKVPGQPAPPVTRAALDRVQRVPDIEELLLGLPALRCGNGDVLVVVRVRESDAITLSAEAEAHRKTFADYFQRAVDFGLSSDWFRNAGN